MKSKEVINWRKLPFCLLGSIYGPVRFETYGGIDKYDGKDRMFFFKEPQDEYALTHLQKKSQFGFLLMWPLCFYFWLTIKFQEDGKPGSEIVLNGRAGARWEAGRSLYIWPSFYIGFHLD